MPERYLSETLQTFPGIAHHTAPLIGIEALIYNRLWKAIIEQKLRPGAKLREDVIGETFSISRTVIRKILVIMEQEGIVELPMNRGAYVASPSPQDAKEAVDAAALINVHAVSKITAPGHTIEPDHIERMKRHVALQAGAEAAGSFAEIRIISGEFLVLLVHIYGNRILAGEYENLITRMTLAASLYQRGDRQLRAGAKFQQDLTDRIVEHDQKGAVKLVTGFYEQLEASFDYNPAEDEVDLRKILTGIQE